MSVYSAQKPSFRHHHTISFFIRVAALAIRERRYEADKENEYEVEAFLVLAIHDERQNPAPWIAVDEFEIFECIFIVVEKNTFFLLCFISSYFCRNRNGHLEF